MTPSRRAISEVVEVNPRLPKALASNLDRCVDFVPMADLSEDGIVQPKETRQIRDVLRGYTYFENGDVVVAKITPCLENGKAAYVDNLPCGIGFGSTEFHVLRPGRDIDGQYLFWMLWGPHFRQAAQSNMTGSAGQKRVPASFFARYEIPVPPLAKQKQVSAILDLAESLRVKRRASIGHLDLLVQATFIDMFGDPTTNPKGWPVGVVGDLLAAVNYGTSKKPHETDGKFPILRMNNITYQGGWDFSSLKYVDLAPAEEAKYLVHEGQLLFNRTNSKELVGKTAVYRRATPVAFAGYLVRAIVNEHADSEYVGAFMNTAHTKAYLRSRCKNIIGMANINAQEFQAIPVPKPPVDLQRRFASIVASIEQQRCQLLAHLAELDMLFASLQSRAFSGELCPSSVSRQHASA